MRTARVFVALVGFGVVSSGCSTFRSASARVTSMFPSHRNQPSYAPPPFGAQVRYNYHESTDGSGPSDRTVSAPGNYPEALPPSRSLKESGILVQEIRGRVPHLPYEFTIRASRASDADVGSLVVTVVDPATGRPIPGFPQRIADWQKALLDRHGMEIPITDTQRTAIANAGLTKDKSGTYVNLVVGADLVK